MEAFKAFFPNIEFGVGKWRLAGDIIKDYGRKAMLTIDPYLDANGFSDEISSILGKASVDIIKYTDIVSNPNCFRVDEAAEIARKENCDVVVAVGGGSAMDFGKAVAVVARQPGKAWDYTERTDHEVKRPTDKTLPIVTIPTTAGTGSEATHYAVLNNPEIKEKSTIVSTWVIPKVGIVDPEMMYSMPTELTAHTGIDAFAHSVESYININAHAFSKLLALESIRLVAEYLPPVVANGNNKEAREKMAWASTLGGAAIAHIGPVLGHSLAQPVGGFKNAPHGGSIAACLVKVLEFSYVADLKKFAEIAEAIDPSVRDLPQRAKAEKCPELVARLFKDVNVNVRFRDFGLKEGDIDKVTHIATTGYGFDLVNHPRTVTDDDLKRLYRECL
ncbi:MAG: iron-containing alcohol dehydrogenase [Desulfobacterales bacterium]|nr:MAG: iron-containing alcohol dehydrogenase [Desulfobacterales bacterium]